jgi:DNA-binding transcriptional LysR family regulator
MAVSRRSNCGRSRCGLSPWTLRASRAVMRRVNLLSAMQAYVSVYETRSFSAAAKRLGIGQPSTSKLIAELEEHLGSKLLLRSTRGLSPTAAGTRFYEQAQKTLDAAALAERSVHSSGKALSGRVRVSGTIPLMRRHIIPKLPSFFAAHPGIELDLLLDDHDVGLVAEGVEVAFRVGKLASSELIAKKIGACRRLVVGSIEHFREHGEPRRPTDLEKQPAVIFSRREGGERQTFTRGTKTETVTLRPRLKCSALEGVRAALLAGVGVGIASEWLFGAELTDGRLTVVLQDWQLPSLELWAVSPGGRRVSAEARAFVEFVETELPKTLFRVR